MRSVATEMPKKDQHGFINKLPADEQGTGVPGGIGGGDLFSAKTILYVGVPNVNLPLRKAEELGGKRVLEPISRPGGTLVAAQFADIEGNIMSLAGPK